MTKETPFQSILDTLLDESAAFPGRYLNRFSDLDPAQLKALLQVWPKLSAPRKLRMLEQLEKLAKEETILSFESIACALLNDLDARVRTLAIHLLMECEDAKLVPLYLNILNNDDDKEARATAVTALGKFIYLGEIEKIPENIHQEVASQLLATVHFDKDDLVQRRALEALGRSSHTDVPALIETAYARKEPHWVASALIAMGHSNDTRWSKQVLAMVMNPNINIRVESIRAAGEIPLISARPILLDMLADEDDSEIRNVMTWALSNIGGEGVRERLEELLEAAPDDEEAEFLEEALENLDFTEDMRSFELLVADPKEKEGD